MAYIAIVETSKQFNVTRSRIYRAIESGKITAQIDDDGTKRIQIADMLLEQLKQAQEREQFYKSEIANIRDFKRLLPLKPPLPCRYKRTARSCSKHKK